MKTVYFILGVHRSGTSALAGVLNILGLDLGSDLMPATEMNPKGYFENMLTYKINEKILSENNSSWESCHFNIDNISKEKRKSYKNEIKKFIDEEFRYTKKFVIKDPRICLLFPIWELACLDLGIEIKIILPYRNPIEVANSLKKRNSFSIGKSLILWSHHFLSAEYFSRKYERVFLSFDKLLNDTEKAVEILCSFVELKSKKINLINEFLDKKNKHNNIAIENFTNDTPAFLQNLILLLKESNFDKKAIDKIRKDFYYSLQMFQHTEILGNKVNEKKQNTEIGKLNKKIGLLENIKDVAKPDEGYYQQKYSDLQNYGGNISEHYYKHGKSEGRIPNQYCEYFNINTNELTSNTEIIFSQQSQLKEKNNTIQQIQLENTILKQSKKENLQEIAILNKKTDKVLEDLEILINKKHKKDDKNSTIQNLQTQKQQMKESLMTERNNNSELIAKYTTQKIKLKQVKQQLDNNNYIIQKFQAEKNILKTQNQQIEGSLKTERNNNHELIANSTNQENQLKQKNQELESNQQKTLIIQEEIVALHTKNKIGINTIEKLNIQIDEIVEDLINIKKSKCWLYTKPIRNLQKLFKD